MEEIKKKAREMLRNEIAKYPQIDALGTIDIIDSIIDLAVSKERERKDAQILEFIRSGKPAPWNDTGWSVELSDVEKFIINTK